MQNLNIEGAAKKPLSMLKEFREFAMRGNVIDLAVGVIIGGAFGKIVSSVVSDLIMPCVGRLTGGVDFKNLYFSLDSAKTAAAVAADKLATPAELTLDQARTANVPVVAYGQFLTNVVDFLIVAFCIFLMVKLINALKREPVPVAETPPQEKLLIEIRDLLKARS